MNDTRGGRAPSYQDTQSGFLRTQNNGVKYTFLWVNGVSVVFGGGTKT